MVFGILVTLLYLLYLVTNFKRGVILVGMTIQFLSYIGTGIPKIKIFTILVCFIIVIYFIKKRQFRSSENYPQLFFYSSLFFAFSFIISEIYTRTEHHWLTILSNIVTYFMFPFYLWKCIDSEKNLRYALKLLKFVFWASFVFCIMELLLSQNYFTNSISDLFVLEDWTEVKEEIRFGIKRCNSIFAWYMPFGLFASCCFILYFILYHECCYKYNKVNFFLIVGLFMSIACGSRAVLLGLVVAIAILALSRKIRQKVLTPRMVLLLILVSPIILLFLYQFFDSIINSDTSQYAAGSNKEMRLNQWAICLPYWLQSPWIGNGRMYIWDEVKPIYYELYGAESIWFSIFVDYGLLGAFVFLFLLFSCSYYLFKINKTWVCLPVAYLITLSFSPDQGSSYNILLTFTILLLRSHHFLSSKRIKYK